MSTLKPTSSFAWPDPEFLEVSLPIQGYATSVSLDGNQRILIGFKPEEDFGVARLNSDGSVDASFGESGYLSDAFTDESGFESLPESYLQIDDKILVTGAVYRSGNRTFYPAAARYNGDGSPDETFNETGKVVLSIIDPLGPVNVAVTATDKEAQKKHFAARMKSASRLPLLRVEQRVVFHFYRYGVDGELGASYLIALNSDGSLDENFNKTGFLKLLYKDKPMRVRALSQQPDGKILLAAQVADDKSTAVIARINTDGLPDDSFASGGMYAFEDSGTIINCIALTADEKIVTSGTRQQNDTTALVIARLTPAGVPDEAFNKGLPVYHSLADTDLIPLAVQLDATGRIVVAGRSFQPRNSTNRRGVLMRFDESGGLDQASGLVINDEIGEWADLVLPADGGLLVTGHSTFPEFDTPVVARYLTAV